MNKSIYRITQIEAMIRENFALSICEIAERLGVSEMTIRRDLSSPWNRSNLKNIRGMIIGDVVSSANTYSVSTAHDNNRIEKSKIGKAAASLICDGDVVALDIGSSVECVAKAIDSEVCATVICSSYNSFSHLTQNNNLKIHCLGGYFHPQTQVFESPEGLTYLSRVRANILFASAAGIHQQLGITCANEYEIPIKKALIASSAYRVLLLDSCKLGRIQTSFVTNLSSYNKVIIDSKITQEWIDYFEKSNVELMIV